MCPSDEPPSSLNSPESDLSPATSRKKSGREEVPDSSPFRQNIGFQTSRSADEIGTRGVKNKHGIMSKSTGYHAGNVEDWNADNRSIKSAAPEVTTPEEIRYFSNH